MQLRVLHGDRQLRSECRQKRGLVLRQHAAPGGKDAEQTDHVGLGEQRDGDRRFDSRFRRRIAHAGQARVRRDVVDDEHSSGTEGAERELEQPIGESHVRAGQPDARGGVQPVVFAQVDGKPVCLEQLADPGDCRLERVRERELADRLADDGQEGTRSLELERNRPRMEACAQTHAQHGRRTSRASQAQRRSARCRAKTEVEARRSEG